MFGTILIFILVLAVIVLIHELGHFWTARRFGVKVEEFGFGFPPRIAKLFKDKKGTWYTLNLLPVGGFVKMKGEQGESNDEDSFVKKTAGRRAIILSAGVFMNVVLAMVVLSIGFMIGLPQVVDSSLPNYAHVENQKIQVVEVLKESPAAEAGIETGDIILSLDGATPKTTEDIQEYTKTHEGKSFTLFYERDGATKEAELTPRKIQPDAERSTIGISTVETGEVSYPFPHALWVGLKETISYLGLIVGALWSLLVTIFTAQPVPADLVGPVGIAVITGKIVDLGLVYLLQFVAIITLNLAVINIIPFPALDGGRLLFLAIEKVRGKPVNQRVENMIHNVGFILLLILVGIVTVRDIIHIDYINNLF